MTKAIQITRGNYRRLRNAYSVEFELGKLKLGSEFEIESPANISAAVDLRSHIKIGAFSYIAPTDGIGRFIHNCEIGRYCSISAGVWIGPNEHPLDWLSSSPAFYNLRAFNKRQKRVKVLPFQDTKRTVIGNDVWIGSHAFIKGGVRIGNGAVVAAHAVVTKDVPDYAIVAGCPARIVRYRFRPETIRSLLELQWWNYDAADLGEVDWREIDSAIAIIRKRISEGITSYSPPTVDNAALTPYSRNTLFKVKLSRTCVLIKLFGIWIAHWISSGRK